MQHTKYVFLISFALLLTACTEKKETVVNQPALPVEAAAYNVSLQNMGKPSIDGAKDGDGLQKISFAQSTSLPAYKSTPSEDNSKSAEKPSENNEAHEENVIVSNAEEFLAQLGSGKHIKLEAGVYNLTSTIEKFKEENSGVYFRECYDGEELILDGLKNLTIEGSGENETEIVVEPRYASVLNFVGCENINIINLKLGHTIEKGSCVGDVISTVDTSNITIEECLMYGCGAQGLSTENTKNLVMRNSIIEECSEGILFLQNSTDFLFEKNIFRNCKGFSMLSFYNSNNIEFVNCVIKENVSDYGEFFEVQKSSNIKFSACDISNNRGTQTQTSVRSIEFVETKFSGNDFVGEFIGEKYDNAAQLEIKDFKIGGVAWLMTKGMVKQVLGEPENKKASMPYRSLWGQDEVWVFDNMEVGFTENIVSDVFTDKPSPLTSCGIGVGSSKADVLAKYGYNEETDEGQLLFAMEYSKYKLVYLFFNMKDDKVESMGLTLSGY